jgi:hypothetical protein
MHISGVIRSKLHAVNDNTPHANINDNIKTTRDFLFIRSPLRFRRSYCGDKYALGKAAVNELPHPFKTYGFALIFTVFIIALNGKKSSAIKVVDFLPFYAMLN